MKLPLSILVLLLIPSVLGATTIEEYSSGVVRGSIEFEVVLDPTDPTPVVAEAVRPNDIITIIYGKGPTGLDLKVSYFFKTFIDDGWRYEIMLGERNLEVGVGEAIELDYDDDGISDVFIRLIEWENRKGEFEISSQVDIPVEVKEPTQKPEEVVEPEVIVDEGQDDLGLTEVEEEPKVVPTNPVVEPRPIAVQEEEQGTIVLWVLVGVLLLAVLGAVAYTFLTDTTTDKKKKKK